jgi:hypothetical protein
MVASTMVLNFGFRNISVFSFSFGPKDRNFLGVHMSQLTEIFLSHSQLRKVQLQQRKVQLSSVAHFYQKSAIAPF